MKREKTRRSHQPAQISQGRVGTAVGSPSELTDQPLTTDRKQGRDKDRDTMRLTINSKLAGLVPAAHGPAEAALQQP